MPKAVYRMMTLLCALVAPLPVGTNLGLLHLLWMLVSGQLLAARGAVIPGLSACGLSDRAVRRAWAALGQGDWACEQLLARWRALVVAEGRWQPHTHGGYHPVAVDVTAFWRPRLRNCPTVHYHAEAGRALPAIPLGLIARVGSVGGQRLALPLTMVRADTDDPRPGTQERLLVRAAVAQCAADEAVVLDAGFGLALLQEEGATRYVVRCAKNSVFRRATPKPYGGRGRRATRGVIVRPLPRTYKGRAIPATPPDRTATWKEDGVTLRAEIWTDLVRTTTAAEAKVEAEATDPSFTVIAVYDPRYREPLLLASPLPVTVQVLHDLYHDRWPVEQVPLAAKQMLGAARAFVHAPETCQRLPEVALLAGAILSYGAATAPAIPTGFWDRRPQPTPGRLRRALARYPFPHDFPLPARIRTKKARTDHLPTGFWHQRRRRAAPEASAPLDLAA
ncbi:MAG: hypothetical protein M3Y74_01075 [Chloroflexota bacterium]|nr:hypothetical protein [Chloroflexota bacterium]